MPAAVKEAALLVLILTSVMTYTSARAFDYEDQNSEGSVRYLGRVQMKVFRGPTAQGGDWAPHGYWVRQPADTSH